MRYLMLLPLLLVMHATADELDCHSWFADQQQALQQADIHDAGSIRLEGYPHLRANRWLAFLHGEANTDARRQLWLELAREEAHRGWRAELARLAPEQPWQDQLEQCLYQLTRHSAFYGVPIPEVPDGYATWLRVLGVYPVSKILAGPSMRRYQRDMQRRLQRPARLPLRHYLPENFSGNLPVLEDLAPNAFDMPLPREKTRLALLAHYAPVLSVADPKDVNQPGTVVLNDGQPSVDVDTASAYQWLSWTRYRGHNLLQLNYQFWFQRRPKDSMVDIYAGELDSLIWRVTLKPDGNVLYYDTIHGCGCYHKVFAVARGLDPASHVGDRPIFPGIWRQTRPILASVCYWSRTPTIWSGCRSSKPKVSYVAIRHWTPISCVNYRINRAGSAACTTIAVWCRHHGALNASCSGLWACPRPAPCASPDDMPLPSSAAVTLMTRPCRHRYSRNNSYEIDRDGGLFQAL